MWSYVSIFREFRSVHFCFNQMSTEQNNKKVHKSVSQNSKPSSPTNATKPSSPPKSTPPKRGRKAKYATDEARLAARRQQQRDYRARKKQEMEELRKFKQMMEDKEAKPSKGSAKH